MYQPNVANTAKIGDIKQEFGKVVLVLFVYSLKKLFYETFFQH
jgi:hypothetical protein